jgi:GNAT superfamily N-acetyltransferase
MPATVEVVLRGVMGGEVAGVLVVSRPVLNAPWRARAWPGEFGAARLGGMTARDQAAELNERLRCISRVVVVPVYRSRGVATALVRAYLADAETPLTEALAAMGQASPFFERAGMRAVAFPASARRARFAAVLRALHLRPWDLVLPRRALLGLRTAAQRAELVRAARVFADASSATRGLKGARPDRLLPGVAASLVPPRAYVFG